MGIGIQPARYGQGVFHRHRALAPQKAQRTKLEKTSLSAGGF